MLPRLEAEERLCRISDNALGFGVVDQRTAGQIHRTLATVAAGIEETRPAPAKVEDLAGIGIAFVVVDDPAVQEGMSHG